MICGIGIHNYYFTWVPSLDARIQTASLLILLPFSLKMGLKNSSMVCSSSFDNDQLVNIHQHFWKDCLIIVHKLAFHHTNFMEILQL